jgi:hypothetical protein
MDGPSVHQSFAAKHQETGESTPIVVYLTTSRQEEEIQPGKSILVQLQDFQVSGAIRFACPNKDALAGGKYRGEFHVTVSPAR